MFTPTDDEIRTSPFIYPYINARYMEIARAASGRMRPSYLWGVLHAAHLAKTLGVGRISAIEFGVAEGEGLVALEAACFSVDQAFGVAFDVYGFDTGHGLPAPKDVRDLPNLFAEHQYRLDEPALRARLRDAQLILDPIEKTLPTFIDRGCAPVGFVSIDLDLYSSTSKALTLFEAGEELLLPRVHCYFDDITGLTYGVHNGELLAIAEFNASHNTRKISKIQAAEFYVPRIERRSLWTQKVYLAHMLDHSRYGDYDGLVKARAAASSDGG